MASMRRRISWGVALRGAACALFLLLGSRSAEAQRSCSSEPLAVQVLGSGGPYPAGDRASSGYLVWRGGRAVALVDAGGGAFLRFGEAGALLRDLSVVAISHLHPDHVADLPALLWLSEQLRQQPLKVAGPSGAGAFPPFDAFVRRLFDSTGAFPVLGGTLGRPGQGVRLDVATIDATVGTTSVVSSNDGVEVSAIGVPHGNVPALAYRIRVGDRSVVFGTDQNLSDPRFAAFAAGADVLVLHLAISEQAPAMLAQIHARPSVVGGVAASAKPKRLVLSHLMQGPRQLAMPERFSLFDLDAALSEVRKHFPGPITVAGDLRCVSLR